MVLGLKSHGGPNHVRVVEISWIISQYVNTVIMIANACTYLVDSFYDLGNDWASALRCYLEDYEWRMYSQGEIIILKSRMVCNISIVIEQEWYGKQPDYP